MSDEDWARYNEAIRYKADAAYPIWSSTKDPIDINLKDLSGKYYVHVLAKTNYSKTGTASAYDTRTVYGPIKVDNSAPKFENIQVDGSAQQKTVSVRVDELAGINKIEVHFREVRFDADDPESETKTLTVLERNNDGTFSDPNGFGATFENGVLTFTVKAKEHVGLTEEEGGKNFGDFYIGLSGLDIVNNQSSIYSTEDKASFDMRVLFRPYVKVDGEYVTFNDPSDTTVAVISRRPLSVGQCAALPGDTVWLEWHGPNDRAVANPVRYPFVVPGRGLRVQVQPWNAALLANTLQRHEGRQLFWDGSNLRNDQGARVVEVAFSQDYIWVEARAMSGIYDSRVYGFVPQSHLVGRLLCITYGSPLSSDRVLVPVKRFE